MIQAEQLQGVIFDVDDTIIQTVNPDKRTHSLHELARLQAIHEIGRELGHEALLSITHEQNLDAFLNAPTHTSKMAIWVMMHQTGLVDSETLDPDHELLQQISDRKEALYLPIKFAHAKPIPGAPRFIQALVYLGLQDRLAIASSAPRDDLSSSLLIAGVEELFAAERIISHESVTNHKPHPEPYDLAFKSLGLPDDQRRSVLGIDDHPKGIISARDAGVLTCALTTWQPAEAFAAAGVQPDMIAGSYAELRQQLGID